MPQVPPNASELLWAITIVAFVAWEWFKIRAAKDRADVPAKLLEDMQTVKHEVKNSHTTNLRDDIDELKESVANIHRTVTRVDARTERMGDEIRTNKDAHDQLARDTYIAIARAERMIAKHHPEDS